MATGTGALFFPLSSTTDASSKAAKIAPAWVTDGGAEGEEDVKPIAARPFLSLISKAKEYLAREPTPPTPPTTPTRLLASCQRVS